MNWTGFEDPISHMCLAGTVLASWSLTQEMAGSSPLTVMTHFNPLNSINSMKTFDENSFVNIFYSKVELIGSVMFGNF